MALSSLCYLPVSKNDPKKDMRKTMRGLGFNSTLRRAENTTRECGYSHKKGWHLMLHMK
jgi:hypothetical protein